MQQVQSLLMRQLKNHRVRTFPCCLR